MPTVRRVLPPIIARNGPSHASSPSAPRRSPAITASRNFRRTMLTTLQSAQVLLAENHTA